MRTHFLPLLALLLIPWAALHAAETDVLWYDQPAQDWMKEALPIGNGRLAAMVFGTPAVEHLQLNEETIWAGSPNNNPNPDAKDALAEVRKLVFEGKYFEAQTLANLRTRLGDVYYDTQWSKGAAMTLEQVLDLALS